MIRQHISTQVKEVSYQDVSFLNMLYKHNYMATH